MNFNKRESQARKKDKLNSLMLEEKEPEGAEVIEEEESLRLMMIFQIQLIGSSKGLSLQLRTKDSVVLVGHSLQLVLWREDIRFLMESLNHFQSSN